MNLLARALALVAMVAGAGSRAAPALDARDIPTIKALRERRLPGRSSPNDRVYARGGPRHDGGRSVPARFGQTSEQAKRALRLADHKREARREAWDRACRYRKDPERAALMDRFGISEADVEEYLAAIAAGVLS